MISYYYINAFTLLKRQMGVQLAPDPVVGAQIRNYESTTQSSSQGCSPIKGLDLVMELPNREQLNTHRAGNADRTHFSIKGNECKVLVLQY